MVIMNIHRGRALRIAVGVLMAGSLLVGVAGAVPVEQWNRTFGGDSANSVQQTIDGGYIFASSTSYGDAWLIKTNANGIEQWNRTFGGAGGDYAYSVQQASDGGYIIAGDTTSYGTGKIEAWLIKTNANGIEQWNRTFTIPDIYYAWLYTARSVQQTSDGGYILAGYLDATMPEWRDDHRAWLIKTDANGIEQWNMVSRGDGGEYAYSVRQTLDGGYILAGYQESGNSDAWLIKTDANGIWQWDRVFGRGYKKDFAYSVQQTSDGGYILAGYTFSYGAGGADAWLIKTDLNGIEQWNRTFGGITSDGAMSVQQTPDGGYILAGNTYSYGAGVSDIWLIKTDENGIEKWNMTFGGSGWDYAYSGKQTLDGGYILAGGTGSYPGNAWLIKVTKDPIINSCPTGIYFPGTYVLTSDIINSSASTCINIVSNDVVLDGQGHTIDGVKTISTSGVRVYNPAGTLTNVTVKNLNLTDWDYGIGYWNTQNGSIENNILKSNSWGVSLWSNSDYNKLMNNTVNLNIYGIYIDSSIENSLTNNTANNNSDSGIKLFFSDNNKFTNNIASYNKFGFYMDNVALNKLSENIISYNNDSGIYISSNGKNDLINNIIFNNSDGINIIESNYNQIDNNKIINNQKNGIDNNKGMVYGTVGYNNFTNNFIYGNKEDGIHLDGEEHSLISGNTINSNNQGIYLGPRIFYDNPVPSIENTIINNFFENNIDAGMFLSEETHGNLIYDNFFNNSRNAFDDSALGNYWNIEKTNNSNIVGGYYQGGNFWSDYIGKDIDGDYLGDTMLPYNASNYQGIINGGDYHPLLIPFMPCGKKITKNTILNTDVQNCRGTGLEIAADDITLDCNGHTLSGSDSSNIGIHMNGRKNTAVRNCTIRNFYTGILAFNSTFVNVTDNALENNHVGISLENVHKSTILDNNISSNALHGVRLTASSDNTLNKNIFERNGLGLYFSDPISYYNNIEKTRVNGDIYHHLVNRSNVAMQGLALSASAVSNLGKISVINSSLMTLKDLTLSNNNESGTGLFLYRVTNSDLSNITVSDNTYGIRLDSSTNNRVKAKAIRNNYGIYLNFSSVNGISDSNISGNYQGLYLDGSSRNTITNLLTGNNFNGIFLSSSGSNTLQSVWSFHNFNGMLVKDHSSDNEISNINSSNNWIGIRFYNSSMNRLSDSSIIASSQYDFFSSNNSLNNILNLTINRNRVSFSGTDISLRTVQTPPPEDQRGWIFSIGRYLNIGNNSNKSWVILDLNYAPSELGDVKESSLALHRFDSLSGDWNLVPGSAVNANSDYVSANITSSGIFGISGLIKPTKVVYKNTPCITGDAFYTSIRDAVGAAFNGDRIVVCPGNYSENTVTVDKSLDIQSYTGENATVVSGTAGDILKVTASNVNITGFTFKNAKDPGAASIRISGFSVTVSGNIFDSNSDSIFISGSYNNISNNRIVNNTNAGIELGPGSHHNNVTDNMIAFNSKGLLAGSSLKNIIRNNTIRYNDYGIHLGASSRNYSLNYNIINLNNYGIYLSSSSFNEISENSLDSHNINGIWVEKSSNNNTIKKNTIQIAKLSGIRLDSSMNNEISNNTLRTSANGIYILNSNKSTILDNVISNCSDRGIYALGSSFNLTISKNRVTQSWRGIDIENSYLNEISYNVATGNVNSSIRLETSRNNNVSGNTVSTTKHGIYLANSWNNKISKNRAFANNQAGITLVARAIDNTISNNTVKDNALDGIYVLNSDGNTISDNNIDSQDEYGIYLNSSKSTTIHDNFIGNNTFGGIFLTRVADGNTIRNNTIKDNKQKGLIIQQQSNNNWIYQNNFINNSNYTLCNGGGKICQAYDDGNNHWNSSTTGNYWSDWEYCHDYNEDRICDEPYTKIIEGTDWYPYATHMGRVRLVTSVFNLDAQNRLINLQLVDQFGYPLDLPGKRIEILEIGIRRPSPYPPVSGLSSQKIGITAYTPANIGYMLPYSGVTNRQGAMRAIYHVNPEYTTEEYVVTVMAIMEGLKIEIDIPSNYEYPDIFKVTPRYQRYFLQGESQKNQLKIYTDWGTMLLPEKIQLEQPGISENISSDEIYSSSNPLVNLTLDGIKYPRSSITTTKEFDMGFLPIGANTMTIRADSHLGSTSSIQDVYWIILKKNKYLEGPGGLGGMQRSENNPGWISGQDYAQYTSSMTLSKDIIDSYINEKVSPVILKATGRYITLDDNAKKMVRDIVRNTRNYDTVAQDIGDGLEVYYGLTPIEKQNVINGLKENYYSVIKTLDWLINNEMILLSDKFLSYVPNYEIPGWIPYIGGKWGPDLETLVLSDEAHFNTRDGTASSNTQGNIILRLGNFIGNTDLVISGGNSYSPQGSELKLLERTNKYYVQGTAPTPYIWDYGIASVGLYVDYYADMIIVYVPVGDHLEADRGTHYTYGNSKANGKADLHVAKADFNVIAGHGLGFEVSRTNGFRITNFEGIVIARFDWKVFFYKDHWGRKWICNFAPVLYHRDVECWEEEASEPEGWRVMDRRYVNEDYSQFAGIPAEKEPGLSSHTLSLAQDLTLSPAIQESSSPTKETLLIRNVFPEAEPQLAINRENDNMMMVYVHDDITKNISQAFEIYYTRWDGSKWSLPSAITSDLKPDVKPDVVYDTYGNAFAAWVTINNSSLTDTTPLNETIKYSEIAYSKFDRSANEWTAPELMTHNQFFDYDPLLASGNNGKIMAMWYADEDNQISIGGNTLKKYDMNKAIYYSLWNGSSWSLPSLAFSNIPLGNRMELAFTGDRATAVWGQDMDGNSSTDTDREVMYSTWNGTGWTAPYRFTYNSFEDRLPTVIYDGTQTLLAWESIETTSENVTVNNTNKTMTITWFKIYYSTFDGTWFQPVLLTETNEVEQLILAMNPQDKPVLLWQSASQVGTDIFYSVFDREHNSWGAQKQLTSDFSSDVSYSPVITSKNDIISSYVKSEVKLVNETVNDSKQAFNVTVTKNGNSSIYILTHHIFVDLEIANQDITLSEPDPDPGEIVTINANVRNVGDLTLDNIMVRFSEGYPGYEIGTQIVDSIGAGRNTTVSMMWRIPQSNISHDIFVEVDPINDLVEENETNNLAKMTMILPDMAMGSGYINYTSSGDVVINATVGNMGHSAALNVPVSFYYSDSLSFNNMNRTLIKTVNISSIQPGSFKNLDIAWDPSSLNAGYYYVYVIADPDNKMLEEDESNNEQMLILKAFPDIAVEEIKFNDDLEGNVMFDLMVSNQGSFDAKEVNLTLFEEFPFIINSTNDSSNIELDESLVIFNVTRPLIRANERITISGTWDATSGDHEIYAIADPDDMIIEKDEFNNIASIRMRILKRLELSFLDAVDTDSDGLFDNIRADVSASIDGSGSYYLTGKLNGNLSLESSKLVSLEPGVQSIPLNFSGIEIREKGLHGPFTLKNVTLYDEKGIMGRLAGQYNTPPLDPVDFQGSPMTLTQNVSDSGMDTDGDGLFNYLSVSVGVNVTEAGLYTIHGSIYDPSGNFTAPVYSSTFLDAGTGFVLLKFDGATIREKGIDGPYSLGKLTVYDQNQDVLFQDYISYSTKAYNFSDFQDVNTIIKSPVADCGMEKTRCENAGSKVKFNASASYDPDGTIMSYSWEFGDNSTGTGMNPDHTYSSHKWNGSAYQPFLVNLTVTDNNGLTDRKSQNVIIWIAGDANGDGKVNILDASVVGLKWGSNDPCADLNNDGVVNILDASIIGLNWGKSA